MKGITIKTNALKKIDEAVLAQVKQDFDRLGGRVWEKEDHRRVYFSDWFNLEVASKVYAQPYNAYIDLKTGDFACEVSEADWKSEKNKNTERDYWEIYKNIMLSEIVN